MIYRFWVPDNFVNKTWPHCHSWLAGQYEAVLKGDIQGYLLNCSRSGVNVRAHLLRQNFTRDYSSIRSKMLIFFFKFVSFNICFGWSISLKGNAQIPHFRKLCITISLFHKYLANIPISNITAHNSSLPLSCVIIVATPFLAYLSTCLLILRLFEGTIFCTWTCCTLADIQDKSQI